VDVSLAVGDNISVGVLAWWDVGLGG
jgi:hypothetical protein